MNQKIEQLKDNVLSEVKGYWKEVYEEAPALAKEYYRTNFAVSGCILSTLDKDGVDKELYLDLEKIYHRLDDESWRYILSKTSGPSRLGLGRIWRGIREREGKPFPPPKE